METKKSIKTTVITSLIWKFLERGGTQLIQLIVQIVLARLLLPEHFGTIVIISVFISLANVFVQSGFNKALIQKKDADNIDFSSVFYLSLLVAGILYLLLFFSAEYIAEFYHSSELVPVLRVLSITLFFGAINSIQIAYLQKNMMFKKEFMSSMGAIFISGGIGIISAYAGLGVWALVAQQLSSQLFITIILWFTVKWRPKLIFSFKRVKELFSFGWKLLVSSLLHNLYTELRTLIIGRIYSPSTLAFYNRGEQFPHLIVRNINGSIQSVMLPTLASQQDDKKKVKHMMRRAIVTSSYLVFPVMVGLATIAEPLIEILLTDKWLPAVPFLQIFCVSFALQPVQMTNLEVFNALGRSDIYLKLAVIKKIIGLLILTVSIPFGVYAIAWGSVLSALFATIINVYPNKSILNYGFMEQLKDILPSLIISLIMGIVVYSIRIFNLDALILLVLQILVGIILYISLSKIFKIESLNYLVSAMKDIIIKSNRKRLTV